MRIAEEISKLDPSARVELFEFDLTQVSRNPSDKYRFHAGTNSISGDIVWQGLTYTRFPVETSGFEVNAKGTLPRPTLRVSNVTGIMTALDSAYDGLVGAKITRKRTLARYLDAVNFPDRRNMLAHTDNLRHWLPNLSEVIGPYPGPRGMDNGWKQQDSAVTSAVHNISYLTTSIVTAVGETWTLSASFKMAEYRYCLLRFNGGNAFVNTSQVIFDLQEGKVQSTANLDATKVKFYSQGDGWWRISITDVTEATGTIQPVLAFLPAAVTTYVGTIGSGGFVAEPQLEVGALTTAYQPILATFSGNPFADPNQAMPDDIFYIERKVKQDRAMIEYELASAMDLQGQRLPSRLITTSICQWEYRRWNSSTGAFEYPAFGCPYTGSTYFTTEGVETADATKDVCSKDLTTGCKKRYPNTTDILPFGGFPGSKAYKF